MNDAEIAKVLRGARDRIAKPENWTKGTLCRDVSGEQSSSFSTAVCYCSYGAIRKELLTPYDDKLNEVRYIYNRMCDIFGENIVHYNDLHTTTHPDVMRMFDIVIKALEKGQPK